MPDASARPTSSFTSPHRSPIADPRPGSRQHVAGVQRLGREEPLQLRHGARISRLVRAAAERVTSALWFRGIGEKAAFSRVDRACSPSGRRRRVADVMTPTADQDTGPRTLHSRKPSRRRRMSRVRIKASAAKARRVAPRTAERAPASRKFSGAEASSVGSTKGEGFLAAAS